jgi:hypothetical protein
MNTKKFMALLKYWVQYPTIIWIKFPITLFCNFFNFILFIIFTKEFLRQIAMQSFNIFKNYVISKFVELNIIILIYILVTSWLVTDTS